MSGGSSSGGSSLGAAGIGGACTGTLFSARVVLTAAHCTFDQRKREVPPTFRPVLPAFQPFRAKPKAEAASAVSGILRTSRGHGQSNLTLMEMLSNWALLVLITPLPRRPIPLRVLRLADGQATARAGFSQGRRPHAGAGLPHDSDGPCQRLTAAT